MKINVELIPMKVPNYVIQKMPPRPRQEGININGAPKYHLSDLDENVLSQLCDEFRADVFAKAGKQDPR